MVDKWISFLVLFEQMEMTYLIDWMEFQSHDQIIMLQLQLL